MTAQPTPDTDIVSLITGAFGGIARPEHFTNYRHCDECFEHDELLRSRTWETLAIDDVGSMAWNPITMATPEAFAYWLPALTRLALEPMPMGLDWYGYIILFELRRDGPRNERWLFCNPEQRSAVVRLLEHIEATRPAEVEVYGCQPELLDVWTIWSDTGEPSVAV